MKGLRLLLYGPCIILQYMCSPTDTLVQRTVPTQEHFYKSCTTGIFCTVKNCVAVSISVDVEGSAV
jgi:hypothetical protein